MKRKRMIRKKKEKEKEKIKKKKKKGDRPLCVTCYVKNKGLFLDKLNKAIC